MAEQGRIPGANNPGGAYGSKDMLPVRSGGAQAVLPGFGCKLLSIIDVSMELNERTVVYVLDEPPKLKPVCRIPKDECNFTWLDFGAHAGTHVDALFYLFNDKWTSDKIPLDRLIGGCHVLNLADVDDVITDGHLKRFNISRKIVLLRTKNSYDTMEAYNPCHVALSRSGAEYLIRKGITTIGYDYQSFERNGKCDIHRMFMEKNIVCIDNLRLKDAVNMDYGIICLPIKVTGIDAAPARVILVEEEK